MLWRYCNIDTKKGILINHEMSNLQCPPKFSSNRQESIFSISLGLPPYIQDRPICSLHGTRVPIHARCSLDVCHNSDYQELPPQRPSVAYSASFLLFQDLSISILLFNCIACFCFFVARNSRLNIVFQMSEDSSDKICRHGSSFHR